MKAIRNYLLSSGLFAFYQFLIIFILVFASVRAYPFMFGPLPLGGENVLDLMDKWDKSHQTLFSILMVFVMIGGSVGVIITAQNWFELPPIKSVQVDINGKKYEVVLAGKMLRISKGVDNSGFALLIQRALIGILTVPCNILFGLFKFIMCLFSKKYRDAYSRMSVGEYWADLLNLNEISILKVLYSNLFVLLELILGTVVICLSYNMSYLK